MWNGDFVVILLEIIWDIYICIYITNKMICGCLTGPYPKIKLMINDWNLEVHVQTKPCNPALQDWPQNDYSRSGTTMTMPHSVPQQPVLTYQPTRPIIGRFQSNFQIIGRISTRLVQRHQRPVAQQAVLDPLVWANVPAQSWNWFPGRYAKQPPNRTRIVVL